MKKNLFILMLLAGSAAMAQSNEDTLAKQGAKLYDHNDTFCAKKVLVVNRVVNRKTGKVYRQCWQKVRVKSGYIVRRTDGMFLINNKVMRPDHLSYTAFDKKLKSNPND